MNDLKHIAIIMDGNGRWATSKGLPRTAGHKAGVERVRDIAIYANSIGIKVLTLYAFSTENWKRPKEEVSYIFSLPKLFFASYLKEIMENNIKISMIGSLEMVPEEAKSIFKDAIDKTKNNTGMVLNFALNYGGRDEIVKACNNFAKEYKEKDIELLNEETFKNYLMTKEFPEVDLLIRTSNEIRISNFLLYQLAYAEMMFLDVYWPDFTSKHLDECIEKYNSRDRRKGGLSENKNN